MDKSNTATNKLAVFILFYFVFFEWITISIKEAAGLESIGAIRDFLLILVAFFGIYKYKRSSIHLYFLIFVFYVFSLLDMDIRPFANIFSAFVVGYTIKTSFHRSQTILLGIILICALSILYQSINVSSFDQFWFFNYLNDKEGDLFISTQYAYFRDGNIRPTGFMISPSVMGLALIALGYIYKTSIGPRKNPYVVYAIIFTCLQMIQTRALLIGYILYVLIELSVKRINAELIAFIYFAATIFVFLAIVYVGDDSAYVRVFLLNSVFDYLSNGIFFPYFQQEQSIVVDSQLISFFYLSGIAGLFILAAIYVRSIKKAIVPKELLAFNFFSFCIFVSCFQWSYDSFGILVGSYVLGTILNQSSDLSNIKSLHKSSAG